MHHREMRVGACHFLSLFLDHPEELLARLLIHLLGDVMGGLPTRAFTQRLVNLISTSTKVHEGHGPALSALTHGRLLLRLGLPPSAEAVPLEPLHPPWDH